MNDRKAEDGAVSAGKENADAGTDISAARERLAVRISGGAVVIAQANENEGICELHLTPGEALMLLDILQNESERLEEMALKASPIPIRFDFRK